MRYVGGLLGVRRLRACFLALGFVGVMSTAAMAQSATADLGNQMRAQAAEDVANVRQKGLLSAPTTPSSGGEIPVAVVQPADVSDLVGRGANNGATLSEPGVATDPNGIQAVGAFSDLVARPQPDAASIRDLTQGAQDVTRNPENYAAGVMTDQPAECRTETREVSRQEAYQYTCSAEANGSGATEAECELPLRHVIGVTNQYMCVREYNRYPTGAADCERWVAYVDAYPDLVTAFSRCTRRQYGNLCSSKCDFGRAHFGAWGSREGRTVPEGRWVDGPACQYLQADQPNCRMVNQICASTLQPFDYQCEVGLLAFPADDQTCTRRLVHKVDADFNYSCERSRSSGSASWTLSPVCASALEAQYGCVAGVQECLERESLFQSRVCRTGNSVSVDNPVCYRVRTDLVDQDVAYTVRSNWSVPTQRWVTTPGWDAVVGAGCPKISEWMGEPSTYTQDWVCRTGSSVGVENSVCHRIRTDVVDQDVAYTVRSNWNVGSQTWVNTPGWNAVVGAGCTKLSEWNGEPSGYTQDWVCRAGFDRSVASQTCETPRQVVVDLDYRYLGLRQWNGSSHAEDASHAAYRGAGCTRENETCVETSTGPSLQYSCSTGYRMVQTTSNQSCSVPLNVNTATFYDYKCTGRRVFNRVDNVWETADCTGMVGNGQCIRTSGTGPSYLGGEYRCPQPFQSFWVDNGDFPPTIVDQGSVVLETSSNQDTSACASLSSCTATGEVCVEGPETRNINGASVYKDCWRWSRSYSCVSQTREDAPGCVPPAGATVAPGYPTCGWSDSAGTCQWFNYVYNYFGADPAGGCKTYLSEWRCPNPVSGVPATVWGRSNPDYIWRTEVSDTWDNSACSTLASTCTQSGQICIEGAETRTINGLAVYKDCWRYRRTYSCETRTAVNECKVVSTGAIGPLPAGCTVTGTSCLVTDAAGVCIQTQTNYRCPANSGSGGSDVRFAKFQCDNPVPAAEPPASDAREIIYKHLSTGWDTSSCNAVSNDGACSMTGETCIEGAGSRVINGLSIYSDCWKYERNYRCERLTPLNECKVVSTGATGPLPTGCTVTGSRCLIPGQSGSCIQTETQYRCPASSGSGGSDIRFAKFQCDNPVAAAEPPASDSREIIYKHLSTSWDSSSCNAPANDSACSLTGETCIEGAGNRVINGLSIYSECWKYQRDYRCERLTAVNECPPAGGVGCVEQSQRCVQTLASGVCALWEKTYRCDAGQGQCIRDRTDYFCERRLPVGTPTSVPISVVSSVWDEGSCGGVDQSSCTQASSTCDQTSSTVVHGVWQDDAEGLITSVPITAGCQTETRSFTCVRRDAYDDCKLPGTYCQQTSQTCVDRDTNGSCRRYRVSYRCTPPSGTCVRDEQTWWCEVPTNPAAGPPTLVKYVKARIWDDAACVAMLPTLEGHTCSAFVDTCSETSPATRTVDGLSVTEACWKRRRVYSCQRSGQGSDCTVPEACTLNRQECIRDVGESSTAPCRTWNYVYDCQRTITEDKQVEICSNQRFCIEGACFEHSRDESSDFGVAAAAAGTMAEIRNEVEKVVDPTTIQIFKGEARRCAKSGWGLVNCCPQDGGNLSGSLSVLCSPDERKLAEEVKAGKTHFIGAYCDRRILGSCVTRRHRYCSFGSKLGRIIHEQGRPQLPLSWGDASNPTCRGFSPAEFERLDFDTMNLDEFMQDVMARAVVADPTGVLQNMRNTATLFGAGGNNSGQDGRGYDQGTDPGGSMNPPDTAPPTQGEVGPISPGG
ncbi:hypothetical protein PbB2_02766 [Candidatus Phycosocius bacilliformis]|uniref:Conjugal transfer protein TraN n=1 Tax=Candidatus Phycosocius bacilliformis TaxID=1445552 RepID=A0A2P2EDF0_9PROT|nr:conjugal transfer protein TraN [Candidatus Phycosocius bacilliformis]GBF59074.1 hypothetical protein PbB2_02766 [Candidatus Phycosocius bacilliformis]